jgi:hypothetical protein
MKRVFEIELNLVSSFFCPEKEFCQFHDVWISVVMVHKCEIAELHYMTSCFKRNLLQHIRLDIFLIQIILESNL